MTKVKKGVGLLPNLKTVTPRCLMLLTKSLMEKEIWMILTVTAKRMMAMLMNFKIKKIQLKRRNSHHKILPRVKVERAKKMPIKR